MHRNRVGRLSGGERRRLYLLTVLMRSPNFLILDEPTNDLDLMTLNVLDLEEYLAGFTGSLLIVSHDRFFVDKLADHLFIFEGGGLVKDFVGSYSGYRQYMRDREEERRTEARNAGKGSVSATGVTSPANSWKGERKPKLSYKEKMEKEQLEKDALCPPTSSPLTPSVSGRSPASWTKKSSAGWNSTRSGSGWQTAFGNSGAVYKRECLIVRHTINQGAPV